MFKFPSSLPAQSFEKTISSWFEAINLSTSVSILNISTRSQWHYIHQLMNKKALLKKHLGNMNNIQFIILEMLSFPIDSPQEFHQFLEDTIKQTSHQVIFFILGAEILLSEKLELLNYLNDLSLTDKRMRFLLFFQTNITISKFSKQFSRYEIIYQNIIPLTLHEKHDVQHFIHYEAGRYGIVISEEIAKLISYECGGRLYLSKQAVRHYARTREIKQLFTHKEMELAVKMIYEEFEDEEKIVLDAIVNNQIINSQYDEIIEYFKSIHLIEKKNALYSITIPLLTHYIKKKYNKNWNIHFDFQKNLCINGVKVKEVFTKRENRLIYYLYTRKKQIITREEIADVLWSFKKNTFSDWALDMAINRLRTKFKQLGLNKQIINTQRNKGFIFEFE